MVWSSTATLWWILGHVRESRYSVQPFHLSITQSQPQVTFQKVLTLIKYTIGNQNMLTFNIPIMLSYPLGLQICENDEE